jgi:hypothetical protein
MQSKDFACESGYNYEYDLLPKGSIFDLLSIKICRQNIIMGIYEIKIKNWIHNRFVYKL